MKLNKPNFWDKKQITLISIILLPITIIYYLLFQLNKFIKIEGLSHLNEIKEKNERVVFVSGHFNNFELMAMFIDKIGIYLYRDM